MILVQIVEEGLQCFLCVTKIEMDTTFTCVERIVNTCVAGLGVIVEDADCLAKEALSGIEARIREDKFGRERRFNVPREMSTTALLGVLAETKGIPKYSVSDKTRFTAISFILSVTQFAS